MIQFGNTAAPELQEYPEAVEIVNNFRLMQEVGAGLSWANLLEMEYPDYLALVICVNADLAAAEIREAQANANRKDSRGSSSVMIGKQAVMSQVLGAGEDIE